MAFSSQGYHKGSKILLLIVITNYKNNNNNTNKMAKAFMHTDVDCEDHLQGIKNPHQNIFFLQNKCTTRVSP